MAESEAFKLQRLKEEEEELARKQDIIRQIKLLEQSASSMTAPKVVNLTETSQIGLLTEMSVIELQERLAILKVREAEEEAHRREKIYKQKQEKMEVINRKLEELEQRRMERRLQRDLGSVPQTSRPTSVAAMSDISSAKSFNPVLEKIALSKDPGVKELQEKLRLKRQGKIKSSSVVLTVENSLKLLLLFFCSALDQEKIGILCHSRGDSGNECNIDNKCINRWQH